MRLVADDVDAITERYAVSEFDARKFEYCDKMSSELNVDPLRLWLELALIGSIVRSTQFHEFAQQAVNRGTIAGILVAPKMRSQPIAAADVARELVSIAEEGPQGRLPDIAGPQ
jgi:hypothetical protein